MSEKIKFSEYTHRFLARFVIEAKTPLAVGSGEKDIITDALVATDVNGLPYIPGTSIAGVVRSMLKQENIDTDQFFGFQKGKNGEGSQIIFTEAKIINSEEKVIDGMDLKAMEDALLKEYAELPIRQHVRINEKGVTEKAGKFDEQVVFAGTRFCFEVEMVAKSEDTADFDKALQQVQRQTFRIGSGTRCGFGEIEVIKYQRCILNLKNEDDLNLYLSKSSNLSVDWEGWESVETNKEVNADGWVKYELKIKPEDFFLFGSGFGDDDVDVAPVKERTVKWDNGKGELSNDLILIPATSVKGALAHRVAFHWNRLNGFFAGDNRAKVGNDNPAVQILFGYTSDNGKEIRRGNLLFSDIIEDRQLQDKILNHVAIDRFTGGAIDGALFSERATYVTDNNKWFTLTVLVPKAILEKEDETGEKIYQSALEEAMKDICKGMLPLGGGVNRGNGVFTGSLIKDGETIYESK